MEIRRDNGKNSLNEIQRVQDELVYFFPKNYIDLINNHDAVRLEENIFNFTNIYNNVDERDLNFLSFKSDHLDSDILSNQDNVNDLENYGIKDLVVFGICANGDYICFDYREDSQTSNPKIVLVYHDDFVDFEDGTSSMVVNNVANDFDDFLNLLHE
ncbi:SMI1/KNR4 family protein [Acinetobacter guillouiae]|uniref:SMI1/KNR4 family protein n=1 Tax=Acinetobacter guillouiae TaxID=106649 RepID=UPI00125F76A8|nr:SMI1/KNR4 family protein [Acinetobacter guillouiae]